MQLSDHFSLHEFEASNKAAELGIDNSVPSALIPTIQWGCENVLEPIRDLLGAPLSIGPDHSGYRCPELNVAVGGKVSPPSQHMKGEAVDFVPQGAAGLQETYEKIAESDIPFDQLIYEHGAWIHVSWNPLRQPRHECLIIDDNGTRTYYPKG